MLRLLVMLLGGLLLPLLAAAQSADAIPEALLAESDAVVRLDETETTYTSPTNVVERHHRQITILRQSAARKGFFTCVVDRNSALKSFAGTVRDAHGKVIRKLKRSELKYSEYSSGLADDAGYYTLEILAPTVPYTVDVEYEIACNDGILAFAPFLPVASTATSLEKAAYTLSVPAGTPLGYKCCRTGEPEKRTEKERDIYRWQLEQLPAVEAEEMMPRLIDLLPMVFAVPYVFRYGQTQGSMRDWQSFGTWQQELLEGRDALPDALRREVHALTDTLATPREKVRALYDYLGATTRYVSIQLGIGGLQPMPAAEVFRTKFGDCKALANYLRALLAECGIDSDYAIIHLDRPRMFRDFASANQANHAILRVPLAADTLWLECTNTEIVRLHPRRYRRTRRHPHHARGRRFHDAAPVCRLAEPHGPPRGAGRRTRRFGRGARHRTLRGRAVRMEDGISETRRTRSDRLPARGAETPDGRHHADRLHGAQGVDPRDRDHLRLHGDALRQLLGRAGLRAALSLP